MQKDCTYKDNQLAHYTKAEDEETNMFYVGHDTTVQEEAKVWFVDSGCSNHMTANKNILHNVDTTNLTRVKMGNGQLVDTLGRGNIVVHTKNGKMFIKDVMLVPNLKQNLLSLGQLIEHGYYLYFGDNTCKIYDRRNRQQLLAKIEMRKSRSFPLTIEYATQSAFKMEVQEDSKLWHKRLGHLNFQSLKKLQEKEMVHGLPILRSDRGGEYTSTEFDKFCQDIGLERQLTVSYTPQQNGVAERKNRTIVEMAKAMLHDKGIPQYLWGEAVNTAVYLMNKHPTMAVEDKTPFEA
ncbi:hypothetical protein ACFXTI_029233 [Malus domestica]